MDVIGYQMPDDLYYQKGFMWAKITGNIARVGLIDYAQKLAGDISYVELPFEGDEVSQGSEVGSVETGKWVGKLFAPLSGKITKVNEKLNDDPTLINRDPYGEGWAFEIEITDASEIANLMDVSAAAEWLKEEVKNTDASFFIPYTFFIYSSVQYPYTKT